MIDKPIVCSVKWRFFYSLLLMLLGHFGQYRKKPKLGLDKVLRIPHYYGHLFRVCGYVMEWGGSEDAVLLALLHDLLEDTIIPKWVLRPLGKHMVIKVEILTQNPLLPKSLRKRDYCNRVIASKDLDVILVAVCDKWDNWKSYKMEGYIPPNTIEYYQYFTLHLSKVINHSLLLRLKDEVRAVCKEERL